MLTVTILLAHPVYMVKIKNLYVDVFVCRTTAFTGWSDVYYIYSYIYIY